MQIKFEATKLKEANAYVDLLEPPKISFNTLEEEQKHHSFMSKIFNFLFK